MPKRLRGNAILIAALLSAVAWPSEAVGQSDVRLAARAGVPVRSTPSADATVVESLPNMAKVTVLEVMGNWLKIATSSRVGYVKASDVSAVAVTPVVSVLEVPSLIYQTQSGQTLAGYKDPGTATLFSVLLTGGGHFYAGDTKKGAVLLGVGVGSLIAAAAATGASCNGYSCSSSTAPLLLGSLAYLGTWVYGIADSGNAARRHNAAVGLRTVGSRLRINQLGNGTTVIGVSLSSLIP